MHLTKSVQDRLTKRTQVQPVERQQVETEQIQSSMDVEHEQIPPVEEPVKDEAIQVPEGASVPRGCRFYLGYLHRRQKSVDIPEECLECGHVVDCLSPAARTIEEDSSNP
jgi:hypothetical protein